MSEAVLGLVQRCFINLLELDPKGVVFVKQVFSNAPHQIPKNTWGLAGQTPNSFDPLAVVHNELTAMTIPFLSASHENTFLHSDIVRYASETRDSQKMFQIKMLSTLLTSVNNNDNHGI